MKTAQKTKQTSKPQYFAALDGFRGVLAIMIAVYHTMWLSHANQTSLLTNGPALVDLFFVFSGFLMFTLYDGRINNGAQGRDFIKRRVARIYPIHFVMLLVATSYAVARLAAHWVGFATVTPGERLPFQPGATETMQGFISNLTLTQSMGFHDHLSYNMPSWTVSVEFWTYFVFLGMMLWMRPTKSWHFGLIALLLAVNYSVLSTLKPDMDFHYDLGFWRCLGGFFTGVLVAAAYKNFAPKIKEAAKKNPSNSRKLGTLIEWLVLGMLVCFVVYLPGKAQFFIAPVAFIFVLTFAFDMGGVSRFMGAKVFRYLAMISYSVYMVHIMISIVFAVVAELVLPRTIGPLWNATYVGGDIYLALYVFFVVLTAHFTYKYIEVPGRIAIQKFDFTGKIKGFKAKLA